MRRNFAMSVALVGNSEFHLPHILIRCWKFFIFLVCDLFSH
jgi:hypothetical protein